jgi:hypothetical protein
MDGTSAQFAPCVNRRRPPGRGMLGPARAHGCKPFKIGHETNLQHGAYTARCWSSILACCTPNINARTAMHLSACMPAA